MTTFKIVVRKEFTHNSYFVLAFKKANYRRILRLSNCQLVKDFNNAINIINENLLLITNLKSRYMITKIYNNEDEDRIYFDILS